MEGDLPGQVRDACSQAAADYGAVPENILDYRCADLAGFYQDGVIYTSKEAMEAFGVMNYSDIYQIFVVPLEDYNRIMGTEETLENNEVLLYMTKTAFSGEGITFDFLEGQEPFRVKKQVEEYIDNGVDAMQIVPSLFLFVPDFKSFTAPMETLMDRFGEGSLMNYHWNYGFDLDCGDETQIQIENRVKELTEGLSVEEGPGLFAVKTEGAAANRNYFYSIYGSLFFLGILLGIVFLFAAVLMMYYKQISEGYEDQGRYEIMQKVGMTKREIKRSINSQVLTVFFLPLVTAFLHMAFAFPMLQKMLLAFNLTNVRLLVWTTCGCCLLFALFYVLAYQVTSRAYYKIVTV